MYARTDNGVRTRQMSVTNGATTIKGINEGKGWRVGLI